MEIREIRWVSTEEASKQLRLRPRTVQDLAARGLIWGARKLGSGPKAHWMFPDPVIRVRAARGPRHRPGVPPDRLPPWPERPH